ncbi:hypothetical protein [Halonatronum saccharophilum]|uniref:hypothetical protein n=1 Tax=Halonatronum saccharophilum TaxID=150060 RepID=UPI0004B81BA3|nr:hypothetical protein [Halonatronum saccharophilum]
MKEGVPEDLESQLSILNAKIKEMEEKQEKMYSLLQENISGDELEEIRDDYYQR